MGPELFGPDRTHHPAPRRERRGVSGGASTPPGFPVLQLSGVTVRARDPLLADVDWRLCAGERWVVLGPNGSGKTTLLQVAAARLGRRPGRWRSSGSGSGRSMCAPCVRGWPGQWLGHPPAPRRRHGA